jgi:hypothetical protein
MALSLGGGTALSKMCFEQLFTEIHKTKLGRFKDVVSKDESRRKNRLFNVDATFFESLKQTFSSTTDYGVILRNIQRHEAAGSLALVGNFKFLVDANARQVLEGGGGTLGFMYSPTKRETAKIDSRLNCLLVEEHVYAFTWCPDEQLSKTYHALMGLITTAKLGIAIVEAVGTFGVASGSLIDAIGDASLTAKGIYDLYKNESTEKILSLLGQGPEMYEDLTTIKDHKDAFDNPDAAATDRANRGALRDGGSQDFSEVTIGNDTKTVESRFWAAREETPGEKERRLASEHNESEQRLAKLHFVVVQHITPVVQVRNNVNYEYESGKASCDIETYMGKHAIIRTGVTNREKFQKLVDTKKAELSGHEDFLGNFLRPWAIEGLYVQWFRSGGSEMTPGTLAPEDSALWTDIWGWDISKFELAESKRGVKLPIPPKDLEDWRKDQDAAKALVAKAEAFRREKEAKKQLFQEQSNTISERMKAQEARANHARQLQQRDAEHARQLQQMQAEAAQLLQQQKLENDKREQLEAAKAAEKRLRDHAKNVAADAAKFGKQRNEFLVQAERNRIATEEANRARQDAARKAAAESERAAAQKAAEESERARRDAAQKAAIQQKAQLARLLKNEALPNTQKFQKLTTTRSMGGLWENARNNPKLLKIDDYLGRWADVKQKFPEDIPKLKTALTTIIVGCDSYIEEKRKATTEGGTDSERLPSVMELRNQAEGLISSIDDLQGELVGAL